MPFFTDTQFIKLLKNGTPDQTGKDHKPVVRLFLPGTAVVFLLTEIDTCRRNLAFGLCDLGLGCPELGLVNLDELRDLRTGDGYQIERDNDFTAKHPLSVYTSAAKRFNAISCDETELEEQGSFFFMHRDCS